MSLISPLMPVPHSRFYLSQGSADFLITRKRTDLEEYDDLLRDDRLQDEYDDEDDERDLDLDEYELCTTTTQFTAARH